MGTSHTPKSLTGINVAIALTESVLDMPSVVPVGDIAHTLDATGIYFFEDESSINFVIPISGGDDSFIIGCPHGLIQRIEN